MTGTSPTRKPKRNGSPKPSGNGAKARGATIGEYPIELVNMTREDNAGFAADAYARIHGLGCICVTYCVGGLSTCNSIAGAYAEKSPVIVLSGSPGISERAHNPLLHHKVKGFETQFEVFQKITVASAVLDNPEHAFSEIDRVLE